MTGGPQRPRRADVSAADPSAPADVAAEVDVDVTVPGRDVTIAAQLRPGRITAVLGPNGAGKSTLLGAIAGTVPAQGTITVAGRPLQGLPLHARRITHLGQDPTVFDHLSVLDNAAYGPRAAGLPRAAAQSRARELLTAVGLEDLADRRAGDLSGGQAQRLALARALATDPDLVLLDEPFAALDVTARARLRALLQRLLTGRTVLLVTHDLVDVLALADDLLVLEDGRVIQQGPRDAVLVEPTTSFLAELTGRVLLHGTIGHGRFETDGGMTLPLPDRLEDGPAGASAPQEGTVGEHPTGRRRALLDPGQVRVSTDGQGIELPVTAVDPVGAQLLVRLGEIAALVDPAQARRLGLFAPEAAARVEVPPSALRVYAGADERDSQP